VCRDLADAAKPAASHSNLRFEHLVDVWQPQIGEADDTGANLGTAAAPISSAIARTNSLSPIGCISSAPLVR